MRFIYLLLITLIFTACGHHKIRFSKVDRKQKVVEIDEISSLKKKKSESVDYSSSAEAAPETEIETSSSVSEDEMEESTQELVVEPSSNTVAHFPETVEDSVTLTPAEIDSITEEALRAEKSGSISLIFGILFYLSIIASFILLLFAVFGTSDAFIIIFTIALGLFAMFSAIFSLIMGIRSLSARYNTPKGKKRAIIGVILSGFAIFLFLLNLALSVL